MDTKTTVDFLRQKTEELRRENLIGQNKAKLFKLSAEYILAQRLNGSNSKELLEAETKLLKMIQRGAVPPGDALKLSDVQELVDLLSETEPKSRRLNAAYRA